MNTNKLERNPMLPLNSAVKPASSKTRTAADLMPVARLAVNEAFKGYKAEIPQGVQDAISKLLIKACFED